MLSFIELGIWLKIKSLEDFIMATYPSGWLFRKVLLLRLHFLSHLRSYTLFSEFREKWGEEERVGLDEFQGKLWTPCLISDDHSTNISGL